MIVTLYRIDRTAQTVSFITCEDTDNAIQENLMEQNEVQTVSFDDLLTHLEEFKDRFIEFEGLAVKMIVRMGKADKEHTVPYAAFNDFAELNQDNFFLSLYAKTLRTLYDEGRSSANSLLKAAVAGKILREYKDRCNAMMSGIRDMLNDGWNFGTQPEEMQFFRTDSVAYVLRGKRTYEVWHIADAALTGFFYDLGEAIHLLGLHVLQCDFCHRRYLGTLRSVSCSRQKCKLAYTKQQRKSKEQTPYIHERNVYNGYIRVAVCRFKKEVHGDQELADQLKEQAKKIFEPLFIALSEYELEDRLPDEALDNLYDQKKAEISELAEKMVQEWRKAHGL